MTASIRRVFQKQLIKIGSRRMFRYIGIAIVISTIGFHVFRLSIPEQTLDINNIPDMNIESMKCKDSNTDNSPNNGDHQNLILIYKIPSFLKRITKTMNFEHCDVSNCILTEDIRLINISKSVIFHGRALPEVAPFKYDNQIWVFLELESPPYIALNYTFPQWRDSFDLTMTYRSDSDIFYPYGHIIQKEMDEVKEPEYRNVLKKKDKLVAWIVSHCGAVSGRDEYVKRLQKFIPVDIYGRCGTLTCGKNTLICYQEISSRYKFYFAFENSLCEDYYTEKIFFNYYTGVNMVAVVRGGPGYRKYFPSGTYIDTADFSHPKDLANFLLELDSNDEKYINYLKRKSKYKVIANLNDIFKKSLCELCQKLNNKNHRNMKPINIKTWIQTSRCYKPNDII